MQEKTRVHQMLQGLEAKEDVGVDVVTRKIFSPGTNSFQSFFPDPFNSFLVKVDAKAMHSPVLGVQPKEILYMRP